jgi:hypothetical protein
MELMVAATAFALPLRLLREAKREVLRGLPWLRSDDAAARKFTRSVLGMQPVSGMPRDQTLRRLGVGKAR